MSFTTADLCDAHGDDVQVADPILSPFGGAAIFSGPISTLLVHEDNVLVRAALEESGEGRVLVVDGQGSLGCALVGDRLAALAKQSGWAGIVVHGCIRDSAEIATILIGVLAIATCPRRSNKGGQGQRDVDLRFAGVTFEAGHHLYADADGLLVAPRALT